MVTVLKRVAKMVTVWGGNHCNWGRGHHVYGLEGYHGNCLGRGAPW